MSTISFKEFVQESDSILEENIKIQTILYMVENLDSINESELNESQILEGISDRLNKMGLKLHKSKGILDYIKSIATGIGKLFLYIIKGDVEKAKELLKSIKKEDVMDFLYKLDLGTLHLFTGPLHMIDAWTGWDLSVKMEHHMEKGKGISDIVKKAISSVKNGIQQLFTKDSTKQEKLLGYVGNIEKEIEVK